MALLGGNNGSGFGANASTALGYENPAFQIKIVAPNDRMQQKQNHPRSNPGGEMGDNLREGQTVTANINRKVTVVTVTTIHRNSQGGVIFVDVKDKEGKIHKVDISRINNANAYDDDVPDTLSGAISAPAVMAENIHILNFSNFIKI